MEKGSVKWKEGTGSVLPLHLIQTLASACSLLQLYGEAQVFSFIPATFWNTLLFVVCLLQINSNL